MQKTHNKRLTENARSLRKKMTKEERHLWYDFLKGLPTMVHSILSVLENKMMLCVMPIYSH